MLTLYVSASFESALFLHYILILTLSFASDAGQNKEGIGSLYLSNDEKFTGQFSNDLVEGHGKFYRQDG